MLPLSQQTDEELLLEARSGFAGPAFAEFYRRHERAVLAYFVRRVQRPEIAADLMSETFAQALASRGSFRPRGEHAGVGWLFGVARHTLARSARRGAVEDRARQRLGIERPQLEDARLAAIDELAGGSGLLAALEELPAEQRGPCAPTSWTRTTTRRSRRGWTARPWSPASA